MPTIARSRLKVLVSALLFVSLVMSARADDLPDAPSTAKRHPTLTAVGLPAAASAPASQVTPNRRTSVVFPARVYWPLVAACGTAAIFDAQMSHSFLVSHPDTTENGSWLLGQRPSLGRYYAMFAVLDGGVAVISYKLVHSRRKPVRIVGWSILGGLTAIHTYVDIVLATR
jgi:hypothetical protein